MRVNLNISFVANRDDVLLGHLKLFRHWGRAFAMRRGLRHYADEYADAAISYGIESFEHFDLSRGVKFRTWARPFIERCLLREFHRQMVGTFARSADLADAAERPEVEEFDDIEHEDEPTELRPLHPKTRLVASLSLQGLRIHQIAEQTGLPAKEVAFHVRMATKQVQRRRDELAGPSLFDEVPDALGAEETVEADAVAA